MKILRILTAGLIFISCHNVQKEYYDNGVLKKEFSLKKGQLQGNYKEYYDNGKLKLAHHYYDGKKIDSSMFFYSRTNENIKLKKKWFDDGNYYKKEFYPNGIIKEEGLVLNTNIAVGRWKFYDNDGKLNEIRIYKNIRDESYLNQGYKFNKKGDTLVYGTNFVDISLYRDTIRLNEPMRAIVFMASKFFKSKESKMMVFLAKGSSNFTKNFSNESKIVLDTFYDLTKDTINQKYYKNFDFSKIVVFGKWFDKTGRKDIRGYVSEYYEKEPTENDSIVKEERIIYFDIPIYVKDSVPNDTSN